MKQDTEVTAETNGSAEPMGDASPPDYFAGRRFMLRSLVEEFVGPSPMGPEIDLAAVTKGAFPSEFTSDGPYVQQGSKEEILCVEPLGSATASEYSIRGAQRRNPTAQTTVLRIEISK